MSHRGTALARTFAAAFEALKEHQKKSPGESAVLVDQIAAHLRSAWPMETTAPAYVPPAAEDQAELCKLKDELAAMRPVYVRALEWREDGCSDKAATKLVNAIDVGEDDPNREGANGG